MSLVTRMRRQRVVRWPLASLESGGQAFDGHGRRVYLAPVEQACRWEETAEEFVDPMGVTRSSSVVAYLDPVFVGEVLMLGTLASVVDAANPTNNLGAWEVKQVSQMPNSRATEYLVKAYL